MTLLWWDWLLCDSKGLRQRGLDPQHRVARTGHVRAMSPRWARTLGLWSRAEPGTLIEAAGVKRPAYDLFKYRHGLITRNTFMRRHGLTDSKTFMIMGQVQLATIAHNRVINFLSQHDGMSHGAAALAASTLPDRYGNPALGILPVEAMLYYYAIEYVLDQTGMTLVSWLESNSDESWINRNAFWKELDCSALVALPPEAAERYPVRDD